MTPTVKVLLGVLLCVATVSKLYGLFRKKSWFWDPEAAFYRNPLLSLDHLVNSALMRIFGKLGVVIFNVVLIVVVWVVFINAVILE